MSLYQNPKILWSTEGGPPVGRKYPEATGQSFKLGQLVEFSSGKIAACASDPGAIFGIANEDASGVEDTMIEVFMIGPFDLIEMTYTGSAPTLMAAYGVAVSSNKSKLDTAETTAKCFVVHKVVDSTNAIVQVRPWIGKSSSTARDCPFEAIFGG